MSLLFVKLRGSVFTEDGFCLRAGEIAPRLRKDSCAFFATLDRSGQRTHLEKIAGCEGDPGDDPAETLCIPLEPYRDAQQGRKLVILMCAHLHAAVDGDREARETLASAWFELCLGRPCGFKHATEATRLDLLAAYYGRGRVLDELNHKGHLDELAKIRPAEMVAEALA